MKTLTCLLGLVALPVYATCVPEVPLNAANVRYALHGDGTVTDNKTGLMWMRCPLGTTFGNNDCTGTAIFFTWVQALEVSPLIDFAGHTDWRLPNVKELTSLVERACFRPSINEVIFPNTPAEGFWTATTYLNTPSAAWAIDFDIGNNGGFNKLDPGYVRMVRKAP